MASDLWGRFLAAEEKYCELPFSVTDGETVLSGAIDLVFREAGGWVIVDYKTDDFEKDPARKKTYQKQLDLYARQIPAQYRRLMERFWPGPLTLVFPARDSLSKILTGGTSTVGIRLTPNPTALAIMEKLGKPITATSANIAGYEPAKSAEQVMMMFGDRLDCIVDGGPAVETRPSTVVTVEKGRLKVLREGLVDIGGD